MSEIKPSCNICNHQAVCLIQRKIRATLIDEGSFIVYDFKHVGPVYEAIAQGCPHYQQKKVF